MLLGSFLGIGLGFLISRQRLVGAARRRRCCSPCWSSPCLEFPVTIDRTGADVIYFTALKHDRAARLGRAADHLRAGGGGPGRPGRGRGALLRATCEPLTAYRWDLIGSLIGIGLFTLLSFVWAPSVVWGIIVGVALVVADRRLAALAHGASRPAR